MRPCVICSVFVILLVVGGVFLMAEFLLYKDGKHMSPPSLDNLLDDYNHHIPEISYQGLNGYEAFTSKSNDNDKQKYWDQLNLYNSIDSESNNGKSELRSASIVSESVVNKINVSVSVKLNETTTNTTSDNTNNIISDLDKFRKHLFEPSVALPSSISYEDDDLSMESYIKDLKRKTAEPDLTNVYYETTESTPVDTTTESHIKFSLLNILVPRFMKTKNYN
jgi:hypothetical protein